MFTATAVSQLIDAGGVGLDDPIGRYVTGLTPETSAVTVRQLLTHGGGLGDFFSLENLHALATARSASDLLPLVAHERPSFLPGSRFAYLSTGFLLLGILIERVSGLTYSEYLRDHLFGPAGMVDTGRDPGPAAHLAVAMTNLPVLPPGAQPPGLRGPSPSSGPQDSSAPSRELVLTGPGGRAL